MDVEGRAEGMALERISDRLSCLRLSLEASAREMEASLRRHGQLTPVLCCGIDGAVEVADGFKRLRAARQLGWQVLRVEVHPARWSEAKLMVLHSNRSQGLSDLEQAWVVRSLYREDQLSQPQIARLMGRDKSWVCRRLMLAEGLATGVEADVRLGLLVASGAREIARLPRGNQEDCARVVVRRGLTTRQTARLVDRLLEASDDAARADELSRAEKGELIAASAGSARGRRPLSHAEWLSLDSARLKQQAVRLHTRILQRPLSSLGEPAATLSRRQLRDLVPILDVLCRTVERVCSVREAAHA